MGVRYLHGMPRRRNLISGRVPRPSLIQVIIQKPINSKLASSFLMIPAAERPQWKIEGVLGTAFVQCRKQVPLSSQFLPAVQLQQVLSRDISHHHTDLTGRKKFLLRSEAQYHFEALRLDSPPRSRMRERAQGRRKGDPRC